jgi:hypothetical protein
VKGTKQGRSAAANRSRGKPEGGDTVPAGGTSTGSSNGQDPAEKVAEDLLTIYRSTPPVDKEAELSGEAYVEFVLEILQIQEEKENWEDWPTASDTYARLENKEVEDIGATNIQSSFVLDIDPSQPQQTRNGFRSTRTSYDPHPRLDDLWEAARDLGFEEAGELAGEVEEGQDGPRAPGGEEAGELAARLAGGTGGGGERSGGGGDKDPTNGLDNRPSSTPQNRRSERSDRQSELDICFVNPPVEGRCNRDQWAWLTRRTKSVSEQWLFLKLVNSSRAATYNSGEEEDGRWVVMHNEKLHDEYGVAYPTRTVWEDSDLIEAKDDGAYVAPHEDGQNEARELRVKQQFLDEWTRLGAEGGSYRYKAHRRELVRTDEPQPLTTSLYDDNGNSIPPLVQDALEVLQGADHEIMLGAVEEAEEAIAEREGAKARDRLTSLRLAKETIERQVVQSQDGVAQLQNAYEIQSISGRVSFKRGGPQGLMGEVKAKAYDLENYRNYDIKSCHTAALKEVAATLEELGVEIDVSPWTEYPGKDDVVDDTGLPRSLVKVVEHAVKYGAVLPASMEQVREFYVEDGEDAGDKSNWPSVAREVHEHAEKGLIDDVDKALSTLRDVFGEMRQVVVEMAEALLTDYYEANHSGGWMENECGVSFGKHTYEEGHEQRSKAMAWMLQGLEAAFCHHLTILSAESSAFSVVANEHDGLIIRVDDEEVFQDDLQSAIETARDRSGFHRADLVEKDFAELEDVEELYGEKEDEEGTEYEETEDEEEEQAAARGPRQAPRRDGDTETNATEVATNPAGFPMARAGPG